MVRIPACHAGGRGFESRPLRQYCKRPARCAGLLFLAPPISDVSPWPVGLSDGEIARKCRLVNYFWLWGDSDASGRNGCMPSQGVTTAVYADRLRADMRLRLLLRRMTISAPRMAVRSSLAWPLRWAMGAVVLGFCAALSLWAFQFGRNIAGLEKGSKEELARLRSDLEAVQTELSAAKTERDQAQAVANTADMLVTAEKSSRDRLMAQVRQLEADNHALREDLGFFEKLIPVVGRDGISIRGLQVDMKGGTKVKWQALVMQAGKNAPEFRGHFEVSFSGTINGKPWVTSLPEGAVAIKIRQHLRLEGEMDIPDQTVVKTVSVSVMDGTVVKATQSISL